MFVIWDVHVHLDFRDSASWLSLGPVSGAGLLEIARDSFMAWGRELGKGRTHLTAAF